MDLGIMTERLCNKREITEEKQIRVQTQDLANILLAAKAKPGDCKRCVKQLQRKELSIKEVHLQTPPTLARRLSSSQETLLSVIRASQKGSLCY